MIVTADQSVYVTGNPDIKGLPVYGANISGNMDHYITGTSYYDIGTVSSFLGTTSSAGTPAYPLGEFSVPNAEMPAVWDVTWEKNPAYCVDQTNITQRLPVPYPNKVSVYPTVNNDDAGTIPEICYINDPTHPNFIYTHVIPQFILDNQLPSSLWVASLDQIPSNGTTTLNVYDTSINNVATMTASSITGGGTGATFPYPTGGPSSPLKAGAYLTSITNQIGSTPITVHGMEPFYIAHNDTSFQGAYGVAIASPKEVSSTTTGTAGQGHTRCTGTQSGTYTVGGTTLPIVTLLTQGKLAIGSATNTVSVGSSPTVVIPFHDNPTTVSTKVDLCNYSTTQYSGAQSALVVNTGSNSVSVVSIGQESFPSGMVSVGSQPVAAAINASETKAYVANYAAGTVSEVDLTALTQTKTLPVMAHPASLTFDSNGVLWVGGQGSIEKVDVVNWVVSASYSVDGTVNGLSYDTQVGSLVQTLLQNGNTSAPVVGATQGNPIAFSNTTNASYTTQGTFNTSTGVTTTSTSLAIGDNAAYTQSVAKSYLAFPGQLAFSPPIYSASNGDITAIVTGSSFTVSVIQTGQVLIRGTLPYPARGVAFASTMLYFTMPDTNSLVSLPLQIP